MDVEDRKSIPPFASLRAFEAVGRVGGIRRAALELDVDHAVVSRHLKALESWLGMPLFNRTAPAPVLNAEGRRYHETVSAALDEVARATRRLSSPRRQEIVLWSVPGFATRWLAGAVHDFKHAQFATEIQLRPTDAPPDFDVDTVDADIRFVRDIAPTAADPRHETLVLARPLVFPVASPEWIARHAPPDGPAGFLDLPLIHEESDGEWRGWFTAHGVPVPERLAGPRLWHAHMTLGAACSGQGVALANALLVGDDIAGGRLAPVKDARGRTLGVEIGAYVLTRRVGEPPDVRFDALLEWLQAHAARMTDGEQRPSPTSRAA